ncbi:hypothetical protein N7G274_006178 [Stereocaulon virgatum]|uniref:Transcription factor 25 n=1 Tax=Stereocaulon virgatum TaxID=373712 RepID=A0ABR4A6C0_9LECA
MSSRALRKLQREQEQQKQQDHLNEEPTSEDESKYEEVPVPKASNAFNMLNEAEEEEEVGKSDIASSEGDEDPKPQSSGIQCADKPAISGKAKAKSKSKKKKKKKKTKAAENPEASSKSIDKINKAPELDEIDLALKSLSKDTKDDPSTSTRVKIDEANIQLYRLLAVESKHLNALNEMKRLFGNAVLENEDEAAGAPRRRGRGPQQLDLGAALAGRHSPASRGQGLAGLALRRNPFILGKEEWPKAPSGGLGMELVEKMEDGTVEYRFVHSTTYQDVQRQFETCVESMDPQRMIQLLQFNPYHISTLLQVSEIAKQQGDHSVSGDLLERALFSFGRSVHSSFTAALAEGKARLDFRRPENREFWLAAWRYTTNLGQRGTWRTAYEWAKLILSLDPEGDPYCVALVLDQLALRGGQSDNYLELSKCRFFNDNLWENRPNVRISSALAQFKLKQAQVSRTTLSECIEHFPWIFARLFQALNIDHIPKSVWGKSPQSERDKFECEVYVHNAKDIWNTPEAISFLVEVAESVESATPGKSSKNAITLDEARHIRLSGVPTLLNLTPREFTNMPTSSSDPLPPPDNLPSYDPAPPADSHRVYQSPFEAVDGLDEDIEVGTPNPQSPEDHDRDLSEAQELRGLQGLFRRFFPFLRPGQAPDDDQVENIARQADEQGVPRELIEEPTALLRELRGVVLESSGNEDENEDARRAPFGPTVESESDSDEGPMPSPSQPTEGGTSPRQTQEPYDDDRNQRWLAGQGMLQLRDFTAQHGTDEHTWPANSGQSIVTEYAKRILLLRQQRTRNFIMDYTLRQGTSQEVKDLVTREIQRVQRHS